MPGGSVDAVAKNPDCPIGILVGGNARSVSCVVVVHPVGPPQPNPQIEGTAGPETKLTVNVIGPVKPPYPINMLLNDAKQQVLVIGVWKGRANVKPGGGGFTTSVRVLVWVMLPLVAVTVTVYVAVGVVKSVGTLTVKLLCPFPEGARVMDGTLSTGRGPPTPFTCPGVMVACRFTVPENPPRDCPNKLKVAVEPAVIVCVDPGGLETLRLKPGTFRVNGTLWDTAPLAPLIVRL